MQLSEEERQKLELLKEQVRQLPENLRYEIFDMRYAWREKGKVFEILTEIKDRFSQFSAGDKASLRDIDWPIETHSEKKQKNLNHILCIRAFHNLYVPSVDSIRWQRVAHGVALHYQLGLDGDPNDRLGKALGKAGINQKRIFQLARLETPEDLNALRRILYLKPPVCWEQLGLSLYYWGDAQKKHLLRDYFLSAPKD